MMPRLELRHEPLRESERAAALELLNRDLAAGADMLNALESSPKDIRLTYLGDRLVAIANIEGAKEQSFLSVFVDPECRRQGIGSMLVRQTEEQLKGGGAMRVMSCFRSDDERTRAFARKRGYEQYFSSALMERNGEPFQIGPLPVRLYTDDDYSVCQALSAKAFHEMRVRVGCFPDSVIAQPSERDRKSWLADASDTYVYLDEGEVVAHGRLCGNEISVVSVRTDRQGHGIGRKLVMYLHNEILRRGHSTVSLWCVVGNYARRVYESLGFTESYTSEFCRKNLSHGAD